MAEVVFALPELDLLVVLRVFMVSSSLINYKVPEFYRRISIVFFGKHVYRSGFP